MSDFGYPQFCPIARASEVLSPRWVLPILRELFIGPQRFTDLERRMGGVSTSVLSKRLVGLEQQGLVTRRELPPPAAAVVYELTARGQALEPAFIELIRWGTLLLAPPVPEQHFEPDWLQLAAQAFARRDASPDVSFELHASGDGPSVVVAGQGGSEGTKVGVPNVDPPDVVVRGPAIVLLGFIAGANSPASLSMHPEVSIEGDDDRIADVPKLFDIPSEDRASVQRLNPVA